MQGNIVRLILAGDNVVQPDDAAMSAKQRGTMSRARGRGRKIGRRGRILVVLVASVVIVAVVLV